MAAACEHSGLVKMRPSGFPPFRRLCSGQQQQHPCFPRAAVHWSHSHAHLRKRWTANWWALQFISRVYHEKCSCRRIHHHMRVLSVVHIFGLFGANCSAYKQTCTKTQSSMAIKGRDRCNSRWRYLSVPCTRELSLHQSAGFAVLPYEQQQQKYHRLLKT